MSSYLERLDAAPAGKKWDLARGWMRSEAMPFYAELRQHRPVLTLPEVTLVTRFTDCCEVLRRHDLFSVAPYAPKQGDYWMAQDDTAQHWREKSVMKAILDLEDLPAIRAWVGEETARRLRDGAQPFDAVNGLTRAVPLALVQHWFGLGGGDTCAMRDWSYWNQMDAFWNQPFDRHPDSDGIVARRNAANERMRAYLVALVQARAADLKAGKDCADPVSRLLRLAGSGAVRMDPAAVVLNVGGLLIGAVETTSHAVCNALDEILSRPEICADARAAALGDTPEAVDGFVHEALRFRPAFPYFFRIARADTELARGTDHEAKVPAESTVLAVSHSAMFDPVGFADPDRFDPKRSPGQGFTFGLGHHECLGRAIGGVMIPEIIRQALRLEGLETDAVDRRGGPVPECWIWRWR